MLTLIGETGTKRTEYFRKAAEDYHVPLSVMEWGKIAELFSLTESETQKLDYENNLIWEEVFEPFQTGRAAVKIDPPSYHIVSLDEMTYQIGTYQKCLQQFERLDAVFLNKPRAILDILDKRKCKKQLEKAQVPVTPMLLEKVENPEMLLTQMEEHRQYSVFLKPVLFSGAAGVTAFRVQPRSGRMQAYTSCKMVEGKLVNTKTLYCMNDREEILALLREVLKFDVMAERWLPKSSFHGKSYDLRVVYQFGHIAHIVVRQANGPITNLHLNNQARKIGELGLDGGTLEVLEKLCGRAVAAFPGLSMAGIDVLLEKNSNKPYIIEMNGQGDLIYQDIFSENRIYKEQVERLTAHGSKF